jgi:cell division protein FtsI/penicillin-binding protein 2
VTDLLCGVVEEGSAKPAKVAGLKMAGKTGTSNKCVNGQYVSSYISSIICFFPADDPIFLVALMIDEPQGLYLGGDVCAPVMHEIAQKLIGLKAYKKS